jgi:hypothetical protein
VRAGRWWWELREARECGLHLKPPGQRATGSFIRVDEVGNQTPAAGMIE